MQFKYEAALTRKRAVLRRVYVGRGKLTAKKILANNTENIFKNHQLEIIKLVILINTFHDSGASHIQSTDWLNNHLNVDYKKVYEIVENIDGTSNISVCKTYSTL